jgi:hypothetical protein
MDDRNNAAEGGQQRTTTQARAGVTGHNVRYVLMFGLGGAVVVLGVMLMVFFRT